jgi:hypothetical protein
VRAHCCEFFDHYLQEQAYDGLLACLEDRDVRVRLMAGHALTCDRCKADAWHPPPEAPDLAARAWGRAAPAAR